MAITRKTITNQAKFHICIYIDICQRAHILYANTGSNVLFVANELRLQELLYIITFSCTDLVLLVFVLKAAEFNSH